MRRPHGKIGLGLAFALNRIETAVWRKSKNVAGEPKKFFDRKPL